MENQLDDEMTDMATFMYELGNRLKKEGSALQSLAKTWFGEDNDEYYDCRQIGIDIRIVGKMVLDLRKHLSLQRHLGSVDKFKYPLFWRLLAANQ